MFQEGQTLGEFEILGRLGQGGMGAVYKARQVSLKRFVALKTLQASLASDPEYIARFHREAIAAAGLNHPNLVQVYSAGETDGLHWFAMEYVEGESAQGRLKRKGRLDISAAIAIGIHVATALDYAWRKAQLIHRDIKPDNIFLSSDGEVKLGDLGLAKSTGEDQSLTTTGASMGTPHYVSPEQGEGKKDVDLRADIYSLGCTLFHFLAGETPFKGDTAMGVMLKHVTSPVPELCGVWPECPAELSRVVAKMMQKNPADRQQTHAEVVADLRRAYDAFTSGTVPSLLTVTQQPAGENRKPETGAERSETAAGAGGANRKGKPLLIVALAAAVILGVVAWFVFGKKDPQPDGAAHAAKAKEQAAAEGWTNLIAAADVKRDSLMEPWTLENGALRSPPRNVATDEDAPGSHQMFVFPVQKPPRNYDLRYRITRNTRGFAVVLAFARDGECGDLRIDGGLGFRLVPPNRGKEKQPIRWLPEGEAHQLLVEVRESRVRISHDGKVQVDHTGAIPNGQRDSAFFPAAKLKGPIIGIGVCGGAITVHSAEFREVDKDGRPVAVKANPAKVAAYAGAWTTRAGRKTFSILEDHTALRTEEDGRKVKGSWQIVDGGFRCKWDEGGAFSGKLSEDGQTINGDGNVQWFRKKP